MSPYKEHKLNILKTTHVHVDRLLDLWTGMFDAEMCQNHMIKLDEHARNFYEDLIKESLEKKESIEYEIKILHEEADTLRRLLNVEVNLPNISAEMPLMTVQSELDKSLTDLRETLRERREVICELLLQQDTLCEELGEQPRPLIADPLPTAEEIDEFREHLEQMRTERTNRLEELIKLRTIIKDFMKTLSVTPLTDSEERLLNQRNPNLTAETMNALREMHKHFAGQIEDLHQRIDHTRNEIEKLWSRLQVDDLAHMNKIRNMSSYTQETYDYLMIELQRCEALRRQNLKTYVEQLRTEIADMWEKTLASDVERRRFSNYYNDCYTEDLLLLHEYELDDLKQHYYANQQIYELFADRKMLWDRMIALEAKANEPGRFNNRGGQLLKEERERKTIATKLPKIEQQITELVHQYEQHTHKPFTVYGENIIELMANEWERKRQTKEQLSSARKQAPHTTGKMQMHPPGTPRNPMSLKNASAISTSTASLRKTPSQSQLAALNAAGATTSRLNKRKLNTKESMTPNAKRSLLQVLNSPSVFLKPKPQTQRSATKPRRVIATTIIRRKSNSRHSGGGGGGGGGQSNGKTIKRRSFNRNAAGQRIPTPKIRIKKPSSDEQTETETDTGASSASEDTYESFQKSIEPQSRSSVLPRTLTEAGGIRERLRIKKPMALSNAIALPKRRNQPTANDSVLDGNTAAALFEKKKLLERLPKPRLVRTPSKQQLNNHSVGGSTTSLNSNSQHQRLAGNVLTLSPGAGSNMRKLTTKNLPIII